MCRGKQSAMEAAGVSSVRELGVLDVEPPELGHVDAHALRVEEHEVHLLECALRRRVQVQLDRAQDRRRRLLLREAASAHAQCTTGVFWLLVGNGSKSRISAQPPVRVFTVRNVQ